MSKTITVKYNGNKVPVFAKKAVYPGVNEIDAAQFTAHINTPTGQAELKRGEWEIITDKTGSDKIEEKTFFDFPVAKQKELILETMDLAYLSDIRDAKEVSKSVKGAAIDRIAELEREFSAEEEE